MGIFEVGIWTNVGESGAKLRKKLSSANEVGVGGGPYLNRSKTSLNMVKIV